MWELKRVKAITKKKINKYKLNKIKITIKYIKISNSCKLTVRFKKV